METPYFISLIFKKLWLKSMGLDVENLQLRGRKKIQYQIGFLFK